MKTLIASLITLFTVLVPLAGCTAMISAPATMPIWIVLGCIFVIRPVIRIIWWLFTLLSLLQSLFIALFGFFVWYDLWHRGADSALQVRDAFFLFLLSAIATIAIIFAMLLAKTKLDSMPRRSLILLLTILAAAFTIGPVVYMATHD